MKIFDKIKDLFTDEIIEEKEEIVDIKEEPKTKLPSIMREEKEENSNIDKIMSDNDLFKDFSNLEKDKGSNTNGNFRFPISFEENEILDEKILSNQNIMLREKEKKVTSAPAVEIYPKKEVKEEKITTFKVSPVISPIYGILDKNYKKEEVQAKTKKDKDISRNTTKVDFETVRKKAYGSLVDDIKENLSSVKVEEKLDNKDISFFELKEDVNEITLGEAENNYSDFGITMDDYKKKEEDVNIVSFDNNDKNVERINVSDPVIDKNKQDDYMEDFEKEINNEDDIFNLIDNMYKENKEEEND